MFVCLSMSVQTSMDVRTRLPAIAVREAVTPTFGPENGSHGHQRSSCCCCFLLALLLLQASSFRHRSSSNFAQAYAYTQVTTLSTIAPWRILFTAQCTLMQSAVLRSHAIRPSVRLSVCLYVTLVDCDQCSHRRLEILETNCTGNQLNTFAICSQKAIHLLSVPGEHAGILGRLEMGQGKSGMLQNKSGDISETRKDRGKVTMDGLQELTNALSNGAIPTPLRPPLPKNWRFATPTENCNLKFRANEY